jgi:peptide/nickel transport system ATP-binding protein
MSSLVADNLTVSTTLDGARVAVLRDLSFRLAPGKVLGLVGESGAGKSMVGRTVAQLLPGGFAVSGGSLTFAGADLVTMDGEARRALLGREIAFVPQEPLSALNPVRTIGAQFAEHLARIGVPAPERRERMLAAFAAVHLPHGAELLARYPHQLSGGMCQRVLIAFAFASRPKLVVADEPTTALDVTIQARIVRLIAEMQERHDTAVLFITHDLRLAAQVCDDILVLYAGRAVEYGPARRVFAAPGHPYTRCLQLANPSMHGRRALYALPERMPGLRAYTAIRGCAFAPRCPNVVDDCALAPPPYAEVGTAHVAACIRTSLTPQIAAGVAPSSEAIAADTTILEVSGLTKRFMSRGLLRRSVFTAVKGVSFALHGSEFVGIVGESGSGKSTLARLIVGLETPSEGRITIAGQDASAQGFDAHRRQHVQMVFQDPQSALNPRRRVASIVTQPLEAAGQTSWQERLARAGLLLGEIGLPADAALRFPTQLSGGQRQRVNIARALCAVPRILVADEIVSGLDVSVQGQLLNLLAALRRERHFAMLFISHDLSVVRYLCDRVLVMYRGEVVESGPTEQVFAAPAHDYTRTLLAAVPPDDPAEVWQGLAAV